MVLARCNAGIVGHFKAIHLTVIRPLLASSSQLHTHRVTLHGALAKTQSRDATPKTACYVGPITNALSHAVGSPKR